jgi:hypothetical protein
MGEMYANCNLKIKWAQNFLSFFTSIWSQHASKSPKEARIIYWLLILFYLVTLSHSVAATLPHIPKVNISRRRKGRECWSGCLLAYSEKVRLSFSFFTYEGAELKKKSLEMISLLLWSRG